MRLAKEQLPAGASLGLVTHTVYGYHASLEALAALISKEPEKRRMLESAGYRDAPLKAVAALLLDFALASNPDGVVLLAMYQEAHLRFNLARLSASLPPQVALDLASRLVPFEPAA